MSETAEVLCEKLLAGHLVVSGFVQESFLLLVREQRAKISVGMSRVVAVPGQSLGLRRHCRPDFWRED